MKLFRGFTFCAVLFFSSFCGLEASLKSYFVDELCYETSKVVFGLMSADSGVVQFLASSNQPVDCEIVWRSGYKISPVLSIVSYNLHPNDELIITDSDRFSVKLVGNGFFPDERKAFVSDGDLTVRFKSNHTKDNRFNKVKFQFVYTMARKFTHELFHSDRSQVNVTTLNGGKRRTAFLTFTVCEGPCSFKEYECRNGKCIDESLVCDSHNHCGDRSDQRKCVPMIEKKLDPTQVTYAGAKTNTWIITVIVGSVILGVVLLALISVFIQQLVKKKKDSADRTDGTTSTHDGHPPASFFAQIRRSFRSTRNPDSEEARSQLQNSENNPISSVYPQIHPSPSIAATTHGPQQPRPSFVSQVKKSFRSVKNPKVGEAKNELQRSENFQTPSMYPEIPSAPELSGIDNPDFRVDGLSHNKI